MTDEEFSTWLLTIEESDRDAVEDWLAGLTSAEYADFLSDFSAAIPSSGCGVTEVLSLSDADQEIWDKVYAGHGPRYEPPENMDDWDGEDYEDLISGAE